MMDTTQNQQQTGLGVYTPGVIEKIRMIADIIVESVREAGELGASSGIVYAALNAHGCTLSQYQSFISALVRSGRLRQSGDLLFAVESEASR
jgi:hypothetical protein